MSTSIHDQELDQHFEKVESEMTKQEVTETPVVYFRFDENSSLITSTLLCKPHRS
jgi:hypothetical protein